MATSATGAAAAIQLPSGQYERVSEETSECAHTYRVIFSNAGDGCGEHWCVECIKCGTVVGAGKGSTIPDGMPGSGVSAWGGLSASEDTDAER
jgi:hypothetical protein